MSSVLPIALLSYLLGSIPFGYILIRLFRGIDIRSSGSGNIGATNVSRTSPTLGIITLLLDALKGAAAVWLGWWLSARMGVSAYSPRVSALAAMMAVVGHLFPVWLKFRGGKGVATGLGSFLVIVPLAVLCSAAIFLVVVLASRYVSLASIVAVAAFPLIVLAMHAYGGTRLALVFMACSSLLIIWKHRTNIRRLVAGTESRIGSRRT